MTEPNSPGAFLPGRKQDRAMSIGEAWDALASPDVEYGFLGTHGVGEEGNFPYVVPMNFAADREAGALYFHSTEKTASKRYRAIQENAKASFTVVDPISAIVPDPQGRPCKFSMRYRSVMVFGEIVQVERAEEKARCLDFLVQQKAAKVPLKEVRPEDVEKVAVWKLDVQHISGKRGG
jgi:nitroimidazol reductase NimA-like FMN-containing flavoprotein (pyridoxamine 5'-phosphate oxidase superfamily)